MSAYLMTSSSRVRAPSGTAPRTLAASVLRPHSSSLTPDEVARRHEQSLKRARLSSGTGGDVFEGAHSKRQKTGTCPPAVTERAASASTGVAALVRASASGAIFPLVDGLLHGEAYALTKSKASELFLHLNQLVGDYDRDVRVREKELSESREANVVLQSRLDKLVERTKVLERNAASAKRSKRELEIKLMETKTERAKDKEEIVSLKEQLDVAHDNQDMRIDDAVARVRNEMTRSFDRRVRELYRLLAEIDGKAKEDMLDLAEVDANLEFIGVLQRP